jgi:acyl-CoA thioesterase-1
MARQWLKNARFALVRALLLYSVMVNSVWAQQASGDSRPVLLAFGNSLTSGYGAAPGFGYPEQLQKTLDADGYAYRVVNMGIPGDTTKSGRARISEALALKPAIVIVELGANDAHTGLTLAETGATLEEIVHLFRDGGAIVVLAQVDAELSNVFDGLARKFGVTSISAFLEGVEDNPKLMIADRLHPNADGYAIVARTVMTSIEPLLKK